MPRLSGYKERHVGNLYDAFQPTMDLDNERPHRLFTNRNIGRSDLTNIQCGESLPGDQNMAVHGVYARATHPDYPQSISWNAWTDRTTVSLIVGERTMLTQPLSELLRREACKGDQPPDEKVRRLAMRLIFCEELFDAINMMDVWELISPSERAYWEERARTAITELDWRIPIRIGIRKSYRVEITTEPESHRAMCSAMKAAGAVPTVWVHLDGILFTDLQ